MRKDRYQQARIDRGMCGNCGCRPLKKGCKDCAHCLHEKNLTQMDRRAFRRENGLCPECTRAVVPGRWACKACLKKHADKARAYRLRCKENQ